MATTSRKRTPKAAAERSQPGKLIYTFPRATRRCAACSAARAPDWPR